MTALNLKNQFVIQNITVCPIAAKPTVRVSLREMEGQEYLVCAVQGFYPNTIRVRWVYGGQIVYFGTTTTGLLPHRDGTFQMTSYLTLGNKTRQDIVCETEHISIEGKLQATLGKFRLFT